MKTYVINLEKSKERRQFMEKQLRSQNIDFEIFPATDAANIDAKKSRPETIWF